MYLIIVDEGLLKAEQLGVFLSEAGKPTYSIELGSTIIVYLARSRARLMLIQLEDVISEAEQAYLPGTTDAHPNWRRHLFRTLEEVVEAGALRRVAGLDRGGAAAFGRLMSERSDNFTAIRATYRLQFHRDFTFRDATALVPYLASLGVSHIYALSNGVLLTVTTADHKEVQHIRGLGFIGLLVSGSHHQPHHLAMAKGEFMHSP
jgi:(1->4)-alpha-D-glucan 1-alpha-D-glucosylmutase